MWIFLNDCFLSIVHKDCARDELLVRARREGDIQKIFPEAAVTKLTNADYLFRAVVKRFEVEEAMVGELRRVAYGNFKGSVTDKPLHDAYLRVWTDMSRLQPTPPYSGLRIKVGDTVTDNHGLFGTIAASGAGGKKKRRRRAKLSPKGR